MCVANRARSAIVEPLRASKHLAVVQIVRTAPPMILDLWEVIPAQTRTQVEAGLRKWVPPTQRAIKFFNRLVFLLEKFRPQLEKGRRRAIEGRFGQRLAGIWRGLGLHVGRAFDGAEVDRHVESSFQRFARLALTAVGDQSQISSRQIENLKSNLQRPR